MSDRLAEQYADFGRVWARDVSPLYEQWATGIAADAEVLALLRELPEPKRQPNLVFAAARWEGAPLVDYSTWRDWLVANWNAVRTTALARTTQTNEAGRCATWLPPLSRIDGPVALLEVGTAAGLCLYPDRYSYEYATPEGTRRVDPADGPSRVTLPCTLDSGMVPTAVPEVMWRHGIDLNPINAADPEAIDWLATLIWPGPAHDGRVARLRGAAEIVATNPPEITRGDLLETVTDAAAAAPRDATLVVFHSAVLLYLTAEQRRRFADIMAGLGDSLGRDVVWLSNETAGTLPEIDAQLRAGLDSTQRFVQTWNGVPIALAGQHGAVYETTPFSR